MFKEFLEIPLPDKWWFVVMLVWVVFWKGLALWKSSRLGQKWWFLVLLVLNTFGILEIFYVYVFSKKREALRRDHRGDDKPNHEGHATGVSTLLENAEPVSDEKEEKEEVKKEPSEDTASSA